MTTDPHLFVRHVSAAVVAVAGFWGVGLARTTAGRDPLSWWLLAGLIPPTYFVVVGSGAL